MVTGSWQARLASFVIKNTFKRRLGRAQSAQAARKLLNGGIQWKTPPGIRINNARVGGVPGEWVEPAEELCHATLLFLHGGGYFACSPRTHRAYTTFFARKGFRVFVPDYRLAPEHPFPAAVMDAAAAYRGLRSELGPGAPIAIAGDSAGGGLVVAALLKLRDESDRLPLGAALFSPFTDLTGSGGSRQRNMNHCAMFTPEGIVHASEWYLAGADPRDPLASPLFGNLRGLPPLLIHVGADETLLDDSMGLAERARAAGVPVELLIWPAVPHDWHLLHPLVPEGRRSLQLAAEFLRRVVS